MLGSDSRLATRTDMPCPHRCNLQGCVQIAAIVLQAGAESQL